MSRIYFPFFSGVFACNVVWSFDQPLVAITCAAVAFGLYLIAWGLDDA